MVDRFALQNYGPEWRMGTRCTIKSLFLIQNVDALKLSDCVYNNAKTTRHLQQKLFCFREILLLVFSKFWSEKLVHIYI